jgi:hypothetical protein
VDERFQHPELIVFGLPLDTMLLMLNAAPAGAWIRAAQPVLADQS